MARDYNRSSLRVRPERVSQLKEVAAYLIASAADGHRQRDWEKEDGPTADEVLRYLLAQWSCWRGRNKKAGVVKREKRRALKAAGLSR